MYSIIHVYHILFIHSSAGGHLDCFHILAILNNAVRYLFKLVFLLFAGTYLGVELLGNKVAILSIWRNLHTVFHSDCTSLHSHYQHTRVPIFPHPHQHLLFVFF